MSKKNNSKVSKKNYPGLKRVNSTNEEGISVRVWEYQGKYFGSLKELDMSKNLSKYMSMKFASKTEFKPVSDDVTSTNDFVEIKEIE